MKKTFLTIVMALFTIVSFAQNDEVTGVRIPTGYQGFVEIGNTLLHFDKNMQTTIQLSTTHGANFNEQLYAGAGVAFEMNKDYLLVPIYVNFRYLFMSRSIASPVLSMRIGSYFNKQIGGYADLAVGVRFASKRDFAVSMLLTGSYFSNITRTFREEWEDPYGYYHYELVERHISPSGLGLRVSIEW